MHELRVPRSSLQILADEIDADLYRIVMRIERMTKEYEDAQKGGNGALRAIRSARAEVRMLMHEYDRSRTV